MIKLIKQNFITFSLTLLIVLIVFSTGLTIYNRHVMVENYAIQKETEEAKRRWTNIFDDFLRRMDMGLRGYALTKNEGVLGPYYTAIDGLKSNLDRIDTLMAEQKLDSIREQFAGIRVKIEDFVDYSKEMKVKVDIDSIKDFVAMLNKDKGSDLWKEYSPIYSKVMSVENKIVEKAQQDYQQAQNRNIIVQVILILIGVPTLLGLIIRLRKDARDRKELLTEFEKNNRKYMFDPGTPLEDDNPKVIIESSIHNLKKASAFIKDISNGNYAVMWEGLVSQNAELNQENLSGELIKMRDQMKRVKEEDERRLWTTEGLAKFADVARNNQDNIQNLSNEVVKFLTKYLNAQQGSLFVLQDDDEGDKYLELTACYAFDKKKFIQKRVEIGTGLVGQAYLEGTTNMLTQIPNGYISITSGLGDATPTCLIIVAMKYNEQVEAIFELAGFKKYEEHEVLFLEKAGEVIASSIYSTKTNEKTTRLLQESQEQAETLKAQEEELRQNMEELQATQENMRRKEKEADSAM